MGIGFGFTNKKPRSLGYYFELKGTPDIINESGNSDFIYRYVMLNAGVTFNLTDRFTLLGGVGYSIQDGSIVRNNIRYTTDETNADLNINLGAMFKLTQSFGLIAGYDTSASAYNFGITLGW